MKNLLATIVSTLALGAFAANVPWNGDGEYALGADDTLTFSSDTTITSASSFTGSGTVIVSGGTLTLNYKITETPFSGFTGAIRIDSGATVDENSSQGFDEDDTYTTSVFGPSAKIVFNGGTLRGFKGQNNTQITGPVAVNADSTLQNDRSNSQQGTNLRISDTVAFTGSGTLTITSGDRWVEFSSGIDFTSFTGGIVLSGNSTQNAKLYGTDYGEGASWTFDANREFLIGPGDWATAKFGALSANKGQIKIGNMFPTLQIGAREDSESVIDVPFTQNNFTLKKVGASSTLTLGANVSFVADTDIAVSAGTLALDGADISPIRTTTFASSSTQRVTSVGATVKAGTAFGKLEIVSGGKLTIPAPSSSAGTYTLFTYGAKDDGVTFDSSNIEVSGLSLSGNSSAAISDDGTGTVSLTIDIPALVWGGSGNWGDADAWKDSVDATKTYTFTAGDSVSIVGGADSASAVTVTLDGNYEVSDLTISGHVVFAGSGSVAITGAYANTGTLTLGENATLCFSGKGTNETNHTLSSGSIASESSGFGTVMVTNCTLTLAYDVKTNCLFEGFSGTITVCEGGFVDCQNTRSANWDETRSPFTSNPTIRFEGGTIRGFMQGNNVKSFNPVNVPEGYAGLIDSRLANSGAGCNLSLTRPISGAGELTVRAQYRWVHLSGDNSGFAGDFIYQNDYNDGYSNFGFSLAKSGSESACWTINTYRPIYILMDGQENQTLKLGALVVTNASGKVGNSTVVAAGIDMQKASTTLEIGGKIGVDSAINVPFTGNAFTLDKVGSNTTLRLGTNVTMVAGSAISVDAGTLVVNATNLNAAVAVEGGATLAGTGTVASVSFAAGAKIGFDSFPENPEAGATVDGIVVASWSGSKPVIANVPVSAKGSWKVRTKSVAAGTQFYAEFVKKGLVIIVN